MKGYLLDTALPWAAIVIINTVNIPKEWMSENMPFVAQIGESLEGVLVWITTVMSLLIGIGVLRMQKKSRVKIDNEIALQERQKAEDKTATIVEQVIKELKEDK